MTLTKPRYSGQITFPDSGPEGPTPTPRGVALISGVSPNASVTLLNLEVDDKSRPQQLDVMQKVKIEQSGDRLTFIGQSLHAANVLKLRGGDQIRKAVIDTKRCKDCPG